MSRASTATIEAPEVHDFDPVVHHYYRRIDIAFSLLSGARITSLCGENGAIDATTTGKPGNGVLIVCPLCATALADITGGGAA